jgi:diguanylate cyclase (GGDEF)-like protein
MANDLERERRRVLRSGHPCCVAIGDIDHFKKINDTHGHAVGDEVLAACAQRFLRNLRPYDMVYRYGGEEFLFCLPDSDVEQAMDVLERMRHALADTPIEATDRNKIAVAASFGVATMDKDTDSEETARRADAALYEAKRTGRNRVCAWSAETASKGNDVP